MHITIHKLCVLRRVQISRSTIIAWLICRYQFPTFFLIVYMVIGVNEPSNTTICPWKIRRGERKNVGIFLKMTNILARGTFFLLWPSPLYTWGKNVQMNRLLKLVAAQLMCARGAVGGCTKRNFYLVSCNWQEFSLKERFPKMVKIKDEKYLHIECAQPVPT